MKIPKAIIDFLKAMEGPLQETTTKYLERNIIDLVEADINAGDVFVYTPEQLIELFGLQPVFQSTLGKDVK